MWIALCLQQTIPSASTCSKCEHAESQSVSLDVQQHLPGHPHVSLLYLTNSNLEPSNSIVVVCVLHMLQWGLYGTRSQMLLTVTSAGHSKLRERYLEQGVWNEVEHCFQQQQKQQHATDRCDEQERNVQLYTNGHDSKDDTCQSSQL